MPIGSQLAGAAAAVGAALLLLLHSKGYTPFFLGYQLYAKTRVGKLIHSYLLQHSSSMRRLLPSRHRHVMETPNALVRIVPFMKDNYAYLVVCKQTLQAAAIDPADAKAMLRAIDEESRLLQRPITLSTIACTHYHHDHAGGNRELVDLMLKTQQEPIEVVGGNEAVEARTRLVQHGDAVRVGQLELQVRAVPCHTMGSVAFLLPLTQQQQQQHWLFTGDFLFSAGCGKFFEGSAANFCASLGDLVRGLPVATTHVFPGHEYTLSNLEFATKVVVGGDGDGAVAREMARVRQVVLDSGEPSIPSTLAKEQEINVFLQAGLPDLCTPALRGRIADLVSANPGLHVQCGADSFDAKLKHLSAAEEIETCEQAVRALRALKDLGGKLVVASVNNNNKL